MSSAKHPAKGSADICLIVEDDIEDVRSELLSKGMKIELASLGETEHLEQ